MKIDSGERGREWERERKCVREMCERYEGESEKKRESERVKERESGVIVCVCVCMWVFMDVCVGVSGCGWERETEREYLCASKFIFIKSSLVWTLWAARIAASMIP